MGSSDQSAQMSIARIAQYVYGRKANARRDVDVIYINY